MRKPKKEEGARQPELQEIIDALEKYREKIYQSVAISPTKFAHMQSAIHAAKNIVRDLYGAKRKPDVAWIK